MTSDKLLDILLWGLGACITGFIFLVGWVIKISVDMGEKVSFKWLEEQFKPEIKGEFKNVNVSLAEIKGAIIGTMDTPGIVSILKDHSRRLSVLEKEIAEIKK